jgi:hypothetical protein
MKNLSVLIVLLLWHLIAVNQYPKHILHPRHLTISSTGHQYDEHRKQTKDGCQLLPEATSHPQKLIY